MFKWSEYLGVGCAVQLCQNIKSNFLRGGGYNWILCCHCWSVRECA